jgi:hypothetical protein
MDDATRTLNIAVMPPRGLDSVHKPDFVPLELGYPASLFRVVANDPPIC